MLRASEVPEWEELRTAAAQIKDRVGRHLADYLVEAEAAMTAAFVTGPLCAVVGFVVGLVRGRGSPPPA